MKKLIAVLLSATFALSLAACETTKGMGKDIQKVGSKIENAASK